MFCWVLFVYTLKFTCLIFSVAAFSYKRQVPPSFLDTGRRNITVPRGGLAELRCRIRNLGPKEVWQTNAECWAIHVPRVFSL